MNTDENFYPIGLSS